MQLHGTDMEEVVAIDPPTFPPHCQCACPVHCVAMEVLVQYLGAVNAQTLLSALTFVNLNTAKFRDIIH